MRDDKLILSKAQAVTASAASTNVLDFQDANHDAGEGKPLYLTISVSAAAAADGAATVTFALQDSADNDTFAAVYSTAAIGKATLVKGYRVLKMALPKGLRRYVRAYYTVATGPLTAGTFEAYISL